MTLSPHIKEDLTWWHDNIRTTRHPIRNYSFEIEIFSDASLSGWGVRCGKEKTHGFWSEQDRSHHINYLELLAAYLGLKCCAKNHKNCNILLRVDNTTAIAYINRMGGIQIPTLNEIARKIWNWCESRNMGLCVLHQIRGE